MQHSVDIVGIVDIDINKDLGHVWCFIQDIVFHLNYILIYFQCINCNVNCVNKIVYSIQQITQLKHYPNVTPVAFSPAMSVLGFGLKNGFFFSSVFSTAPIPFLLPENAERNVSSDGSTPSLASSNICSNSLEGKQNQFRSNKSIVYFI